MSNDFLTGASCFGFCVAALFFLRFWKQSADRLFLVFAIAFALLGIERMVLAIYPIPTEGVPHIYFIRLTAFSLIILAIIQKNRRKE